MGKFYFDKGVMLSKVVKNHQNFEKLSHKDLLEIDFSKIKR